MFNISQGLQPDLRNYLFIKETSMALYKSLSGLPKNEDKERIGNNNKDNLNPEGKDNSNNNRDQNSEDNKLNHDDSAYSRD